MKKLLKLIILFIFFIIVIFSLVALAYPTFIAKTALKPVVNYQCNTELKVSKIWKIASVFMSELEQKQALSRVCNCVSEHATDNVSIKELLTVFIDEKAKNELVSKAIVNSIRGCVVGAINNQ